ncbi:MgtC/SapB family protein [Fusobacterium sp. PH5-44]|uniref:MgtC/SapB family protein n=1 Tax=unclassified Fusobacterium TaxID=2648384 RepID=UPI003D26317E
MNVFVQSLEIKEILIRIVLASIVGGFIGFERGQKNRPAGFRTHILVCLGATFISILEDNTRLNLMQNQNFTGGVAFSIGRYGAQVISGIGFLGAGAIMRDKGKVAGLTTAASLWITGCVGLVIGWGYYKFSIIAAIAVFIVLEVLKIIDIKYLDNKNIHKIKIYYKTSIEEENTLKNTYNTFHEHSLNIKKLDKKVENNEIIFILILPRESNNTFVVRDLTKLEEIQTIEVDQH